MTTTTPAAVERLRENLVKLATKQPGYGMSYEANSFVANGEAELRLYGDRANAAYWLLENGIELAAALTPPAAPEIPAGGWIVASGDGKRWRTWKDGFSAWTDDRDAATRYARKEDAEAVHYHDEDAWFVIAYTPTARPAATAGEVEKAREQIERWFFQELNDAQRADLIRRVLGVEIAREARPQSHQRKALRHILAALASDRGEIERLNEAVRPWADFHGELPDYDHPLRCVYESGIQYAVHLLAKELEVDDWKYCDGTEEFDGDLGGTLMNIVLAAMPKDQDGDPMWPQDVRAALSERPIPYQAETDRSSPAANPSADGAAEVVAPDAGEVKRGTRP